MHFAFVAVPGGLLHFKNLKQLRMFVAVADRSTSLLLPRR